MGAMVIPFPVRGRRTASVRIDWEAVERARQAVHGGVPRVALRILRLIIEAKPASRVLATGSWSIRAGLPGAAEPVTVSPADLISTDQVLKLLDRLARYGGHLVWGRLECRLAATAGGAELALLQSIPRATRQALAPILQAVADHRLASSCWSVLGKEVEGLDLLVLLIENEGSDYLGLFDRKSGRQLIHRLRSGYSVHLRATATAVVTQTE